MRKVFIQKFNFKPIMIIIAVILLMPACNYLTDLTSKLFDKEVQEKEPTYGIVLFQLGNVEIQKLNETSIKLNIQDKVSEGDTVITGKKSNVTIQFGDIGIIRVQQNTKLRVSKLFSKNEGELFIENGQVLSKINKLKKGEEFGIKTPTAVASVRGTEYSTTYKNGKSLIAVKDGKVAVGTKKAAVSEKDKNAYTEQKIIKKGKTAIITEDKSKGNEPEITVRDITQVESLTVKKISIVQMVPEPEKKTINELKTIEKKIKREEIKIDKKLTPEIKKEKIIKLIQKKSVTLAEIKQVFERIDEITLYNQRQLKGAIISRGKIYKVLTTNGTIEIKKNDIKKVTVIK